MSTFRSNTPQSQSVKSVETTTVPGGKVETVTTKVYTSSPKSNLNYETTEETKEFSSGNEMSTFKQKLEHKMLKQSMKQKITEKKTITTTTSSRQESNTKTIQYEESK